MSAASSRRWGSARALAERTPAGRNRYAEFLRAASILVVIVGHRPVITPWLSPDGIFPADHLLTRSQPGRWLTWVFQVIPVFFAVGGYASAPSWATQRDTPYGVRLVTRLRRLVLPALPLLCDISWIALVLPATGMVLTGALGPRREAT